MRWNIRFTADRIDSRGYSRRLKRVQSAIQEGTVSFVLLFFLCVSPSALSQNRPLERAEAERETILERALNRVIEAEVNDNEERAAEALQKTIDAADTTPLGVDFEEIRLITNQNHVKAEPVLGKSKTTIDSKLNTPEDVPDILKSYIGKPVSMKRLAELARDIIMAWRRSDYPLVDVYYPPQDITKGIFQIVVLEAVLGEKRVEGATNSDSTYLTEQLRIEPGDRVNRREVEADLDWLNENPMRTINLIYEKGGKRGTSDIILDTDELRPFSVYAGFGNTGVPLTGEEEWSFGFNWSNPFQTEQSIGYHYSTDLDWDSLSAHSLFYQKYLPWRHIFQVTAAHVRSEGSAPLIQGGNLGVTGLSKQASFGYRVPLERIDKNRNYRHYFTAGFDYKSTNSDLLFGGNTIFDNEIEVGQFRFEYEGALATKKGHTHFTLGLVGSPGGLFGHNEDFFFDLARAGSTAGYWYGYGDFEKSVKLPKGYLFSYRGRAQVSTNRLASTEQLLAGGYRTVRGFEESLVRGDSGLINSFEILTPSFSLKDHLKIESETVDKWNGLVFYDSAILDLVDSEKHGESSPSLSSIGVGINCRLQIKDAIGVGRVSYGIPLGSHGAVDDSVEDGKWHFGFTFRY